MSLHYKQMVIYMINTPLLTRKSSKLLEIRKSGKSENSKKLFCYCLGIVRQISVVKLSCTHCLGGDTSNREVPLCLSLAVHLMALSSL